MSWHDQRVNSKGASASWTLVAELYCIRLVRNVFEIWGWLYKLLDVLHVTFQGQILIFDGDETIQVYMQQMRY
jgi:hypothetical protein